MSELEGYAVVCPRDGLLIHTCRTQARRAKDAYMKERLRFPSEKAWQKLVNQGFRLQRLEFTAVGEPFEGVAHVTLAFEKATDQPTT